MPAVITKQERLTLPESPTSFLHTPRRVVGVDVWLEAPCGMASLLAAARAACTGTHLRVVAAVDAEGMAVDAGGPTGEEPEVLRARFMARCGDVHVTDAAIAELLGAFGERLRWSTLAQLEEFDAVPAYIPLPTGR